MVHSSGHSRGSGGRCEYLLAACLPGRTVYTHPTGSERALSRTRAALQVARPRRRSQGDEQVELHCEHVHGSAHVPELRVLPPVQRHRDLRGGGAAEPREATHPPSPNPGEGAAKPVSTRASDADVEGGQQGVRRGPAGGQQGLGRGSAGGQ
eukprot:970484-Prorocentrum_minimum.AAC.5